MNIDYNVTSFFIDYWMSIITFFLTALVAIVIYVIQREKINPKYLIKNKKIISGIDNMKELKIVYKDRVVPNLSVADILFWNKGKKTLNFLDFANGDVLRIAIDSNVTIVDVQLSLVPNPVNNVKIVRVEENNVYVEFDYLDRNDGFIIQISHTGIDKNSVSVKGTVKGYKDFSIKSEINSKFIVFEYIDPILSRIFGIKLIKSLFQKSKIKFELFNLIFAISMLIVTLAVIGIILFTENSDPTLWIISILYGGISIFLFVRYFYILSISIPKNFRDYFIDSKSN